MRIYSSLDCAVVHQMCRYLLRFILIVFPLVYQPCRGEYETCSQLWCCFCTITKQHSTERTCSVATADPYMTSAPLSIHIDSQTGTCSTLKIPGSKLHPFISINFPSSTNLFRFPSHILIHCFSCTRAPLVCRSSPTLYSILRCKQNRHFQRESSTGKM